MQIIRTRPAFALLLVLLALGLISGVAYAIGKVTGYIPGVGLVNQTAPLRILAEPVVAKRDGITVTISEVVADSDHTFVAFTVDGIIMPAMTRPTCGAMPSLRLPNGTTLSIITGDDGGPIGGQIGSILKLEQSVTYSSVPADVNTVTFTFPCILPEGTGPENWQIPLKLSPAPKDYATPAIEIGVTFAASNPKFTTPPTPTFEMTPAPYDPSFPATPTLVPNGSGLYLDRVIELPDSYILVGNFTDAGDLPGALEVSDDPHDNLPHLQDGQGNPIDFKVREDIQPENMRGGVHYWAYEIPKSVQGPLTITLDQVNIQVSNTTRFNFDAGTDPQVGQKWELNLPIHLGRYDYVIDSAEMIKDGYLFRFHSSPNVPEGTSFILDIPGSSQERGPTSSEEDRRSKTVVKYSENITYLVPPPTGQLTVELTLFETIPLRGPWTLKWTPPSK